MTSEIRVPCAVCGADEPHLMFRSPHAPGPIVVCGRCGLVYVNPREDQRALIYGGPQLSSFPPAALTSRDVADVMSSWEWPLLQAKESERVAIRRNAALALRRIERYRRPPGRLLDYGCGGGFFLSVAAEHGWDTFGVEPLVGHAIYARAKSSATVIADTLRDGSFPPEFFDVVTAFQVFEHLPDPSDVLGKLSRMIRSGGLLLIEVPNIDTWTVRLWRQRHRHFVCDHLYFFSAQSLCALLVKHGLEPLLVYRPRRTMTLRHLFGHWVKQQFSRRVGASLEAFAVRWGLAERVLTFGVGDIVAVMARKP